jgi:hypothetical protein
VKRSPQYTCLLAALAALLLLAACQEDAPVREVGGENNGDENNGGENNGGQNNGGEDAGDAGEDDGEDVSEEDIPDAPTCAQNTDCRGGEVCREGRCREACSAEDPCQGALPACDLAQGVCVGCVGDEDCGADQLCDLAAQACVRAECAVDGDCRGGFSCEGRRCVPIDDLICEPEATRCDGEALLRCSRDGTREEREACAAPARCLVVEGEAACREPACEPYSVGCLDNQAAFACDASGTQQTRLPCRAEQRCEAGACVALACAPSSITCEGDARVVCDARGASREVTRCDDTEGCEGAPFGCACREGECEARVCAPESARCVGNATQACDAQGAAWGAPVACAGDEVCTNGRCLSRQCEPGERVCAGDAVLVCDEDGDARVSTACPSGQTCTGTGDAARCAPVVCGAGEVTCEGTSAISRCNEDGTARALEPCAALNVCVVEGEGARCRPLICAPGSAGCADDRTAFDCDASGTRSTARPCPEGLTCSGDGVCSARICEPGARSCRDQGAVGLCNAEGDGYDEIQECGAEATCQSGRCLSDCELGAGGRSHVGCQFWTVDLDNLESGEAAPHAVVLINPDPAQAATVNITRDGGERALIDAEISPGEALIHEFPTSYEVQGTGLYDGRAWEIRATVPLVVYQFNPLAQEMDFFTSDASLLLPVSSTDQEYLALAWPNRAFSDTQDLKGFATVIAVEAGTTRVTVTPSVDLAAGSGTPAIAAGTSWTAVMGTGQVLHLSPTGGDGVDITGTRIQSTRRVAVFGGHECANIPNNDVQACDHIEQQLSPTATWGTRYVVAPYSPRNNMQRDTWRVLAAQDNTTITTRPAITGLHNQRLMRGQHLQVDTNLPFELTATAPVLVGQYMHGANYPGFASDPECGDNFFTQNGVGDPAFALAVPVEQHRQDYSVLTPESFRDNFLTLIAPTGANIRLDNGAPLRGLVAIPGTGFSTAHIAVSDGFHRVTGDRAFGLIAHGYNCFVSYAYPAGLNLRALR